MRQKENEYIVDPLRLYLEHKGWYCIKTHGNQYQEGLPDLYCCNPQYTPKWVECKIKGHPFTDSQMRVFPKMLLCGVSIWCIEGEDFRGIHGKAELLNAYQKLFRDANMAWYLTPTNRRLHV